MGAMRVLAVCAGVWLVSGCRSITVKHEMPHIYATVDVNIRIQRELEDFFAFEKSRADADTAPDAQGGIKQ